MSAIQNVQVHKKGNIQQGKSWGWPKEGHWCLYPLSPARYDLKEDIKICILKN